MWFRNRQDKSYVGVAVTFILIGAALFAFGLVSWLINSASGLTVVFEPSGKVMGGLIVMALGYIQLELGLIREK
jgi:hypothetical protein